LATLVEPDGNRIGKIGSGDMDIARPVRKIDRSDFRRILDPAILVKVRNVAI
jgi:hypothetical protein